MAKHGRREGVTELFSAAPGQLEVQETSGRGGQAWKGAARPSVSREKLLGFMEHLGSNTEILKRSWKPPTEVARTGSPPMPLNLPRRTMSEADPNLYRPQATGRHSLRSSPHWSLKQSDHRTRFDCAEESLAFAPSCTLLTLTAGKLHSTASLSELHCGTDRVRLCST